jgi:hypothetical protein
MPEGPVPITAIFGFMVEILGKGEGVKTPFEK